MILRLLALLLLLVCTAPVSTWAQTSLEAKAEAIKDTLVSLCLAGGSESTFTAEGNLELRAKIRDVLSGNVGTEAGTKSTFTKHTWEGIVGGISKEMTANQSAQATEARKCMVDNGFPLMSKVLAAQ